MSRTSVVSNDQKNTSSSSIRATHRVTFFDAHHRLDRIVLGVFVLTQHVLVGHEYGIEVVTRMRATALDCLDMMRDIALPDTFHTAVVDALYVSIQHMVSYLQIMERIELVNPKNATLLTSEIERFRDQFDTIPQGLFDVLFAQDTYGTGSQISNTVPPEDLTDIFRKELPVDMYFRKRHLASIRDTSSKNERKVARVQKEYTQEKQVTAPRAPSQDGSQPITHKNTKEIAPPNHSKKSAPVMRTSVVETPKKARRKTLILQELHEKKEAQVGDITSAISGVSEKTIQRDLKELIAEGKVLREGTRRWAIYRAVQ